MNLFNLFHAEEAKFLAALCYGYQQMPKPFFEEGGVRRPWCPVEIAYHAIRRLKDTKGMTFNQMAENDSAQFVPKHIKFDAKGKTIRYVELTEHEKKESNKIIKHILDWDESELEKISEDPEIVKVMTNFGFQKVDPKTRVKMTVETVQRGEDILSVLRGDAGAIEKAKAVKVEPKMAQTREQYMEEMESEIKELDEKIKTSHGPEKTRFKTKKQALLEAIKETAELAEAVPLVSKVNPQIR